MNLRAAIISLLSMAMLHKSMAQDALPIIIPPSPEAGAFARYGEIPVDFSTGVTDISVPIYKIKTGKIEIPISLSYHASGIKVRDIASSVGLGWVLNANGIVSRTILGTDDLSPSNHGTGPYRTVSQFDSLLNSVTTVSSNGATVGEDLRVYQTEYYDKQADRYSYNFNGHAGVFRGDYINNTIKTLGYKPIIINKLGTGGTTHFKIIDESGFTYLFDSTESSSNSAGGGISSWMLNKIISPDSADQVDFYYSIGDTCTDVRASHALTSGNSYKLYQGQGGVPPVLDNVPFYEFNFNESNITTYHLTRRLDSIVSRNTIIQFLYFRDRLDDRKTRINKILILDRLNRDVLRQAVFYQGYFGSLSPNNLRLRLDSVLISGSNSTYSRELYSFKYDTTMGVPPGQGTAYSPGHNYCEDYWGYYKGDGATGYSLIPYEYMDFMPSTHSYERSYYGGNLNPNNVAMQTCILKEITYPTKGKSIFEFESNYTNDNYYYGYTNTNNGIIGGLRIKSIKTVSTISSDTIVKTYKYSPYGATAGITRNLFHYQQNYSYLCQNGASAPRADVVKDKITSNPKFPLTATNSSPIVYSEVAEYFGKDSAHAIGKITYKYNYPLYYNYVYLPIESPNFINIFAFDNGSYEPTLIEKKIYKNESGTYALVSELANTYNEFKVSDFNTGLIIDRTRTYVPLDGGPTYSSAYEYVHEFVYANTKGLTKVYLLTQSKEKTYGINNNFDSTVISYQYDTTSLLPVLSKTANSQGDTIKAAFKYPLDYVSQSPYNLMVQKNILTPIVEEAHYSNNNFLNSTKTNFYNWGSNLIAPQTVESKTLSDSSEVRIRFSSYDAKGNIITVAKENDIKMSYIWDYNLSYPIAEVRNADSISIAATSFEGDGKGNWTYSGSATTHPTSPTGLKGYNLAAGNITKSGLSSGSVYVVSYWKRDSASSVTVNAGSGTLLSSKNGWKLYNHEITGTTSVTVSGSGYIDDLRLYPKGAMMTTYTYRPLLGVTSKSDPNCATTYYEYDNFNRLYVVRDQDRNVLKRICYNYAGQPEICMVGYQNIIKTGSFTKNDCGTGYSGTAVIDTVLAGTYYSAISQSYADSLAQADVNSNGQANANAKGSCNCDVATCTGPSKQCINNQCYTGSLRCVSAVFNSKTGIWTCTYRYIFDIDCSSIFASTTTGTTPCTVDPPCH